jgi:hypothetical protein
VADDKKDSDTKAGAEAKGKPAPAAKKPATTPTAGKAKAAEAKESPQEKATLPAPKAKKGSGRFAWTLVFLLVFFIGGIAATPYLLPQVMPLLPEKAAAYFAPLMAQSSSGAGLADLNAKINQLDAGLKDVRQIASSSQQALQALPAAAPNAVDTDVTALTTRLDALTSQLEQLSAAQADQGDAYARLQKSLEAIPSGEDGGVSPAVVAGLNARLEDVTSARDELAQTVDALSAQVAALNDAARAAPDSAASADALNEIATALRQRLGSVEDRLEIVAQAANTAAAPEALESVNAAVTASLDDFKERLTALESVRQQATAAMVAGLETARLAQAVSNGKAYAAELKALTQLKTQAGPAMPDIGDLLSDIEPFAETGIPSGATLSAQLEDRAREILTAIDTPTGANWWERLLARIRNLVIVRKVGAGAQGSAPPDVLARAESAARVGDWDAVVSEIEGLPQSAKEGFGAWWDHAQARATAQRALADLSARLGVAAADGGGGRAAGSAQ